MAGSLVIKAIFRGVDKMSRTISKVQNKYQKFTKRASRGMRKVNRFATKVGKTVGRGLVKAFKAASVAAVALGAAVGKVIQVGANFEQTMVAATVKLPGDIRKGTAAYKEIEDVVRKVGKTTEFSASQAAEGVNFLAMAGFDAEQSIAALPGVINLATVAQIELGMATDIATDSLGAMGLASDNAAEQQKNLARVTDVMAATTTSANTNMEDMFEAIKEGGPVATTAGASIETFAAMVGELANAGIKGSKAGTTLKNVFTQLTAATPKGAKQLRRFGVAIKDSKGDMRDVFDILGDLEKRLGKLGSAERSAVLKDIFGKIPLAGVNVLLASGADKLRDYRKELEGVTGKTEEMAAVMRDTTQGSINNLKSAIEGVLISLFKVEDKGITGVIDKITEWVRANEKLIVQNVNEFLTSLKENIDSIVFAFEAVAVVVGTIMAVVGAIKVFNAVMLITNAIMMANPVVLIITAIIAAVALAAFLIVKYWDDIVAGYDWMVEKFEAGIKATVDFFVGLGQSIKSIWTEIVDFISRNLMRILGLTNPIIGVVSSVMDLFGDDDEARTTTKRGFHPRVVGSGERTAAAFEERRSISTERTELTIRDESGRAEVTRGKMGTGMKMERTGSF